MTAQPLFCFVVPCFNEEDNVEPTVNSICAAVGDQNHYEIILVNDGSRDQTLKRMQALTKTNFRIKIVDNPVNLGLGGSYKRGVAVAEAKYVMMVPGDDGFPTESIAEILSHIGEADIIIPIVTNQEVRNRFRALASRGFTVLLNWMFWLDIGYYNGAVLHRSDLLRSIEISTNSFAYQGEALIKLIARGATYTHCQVKIRERAAGESSALKPRNQIAVWKTILHLVSAVGMFRKIRIGG
jgi:glycosyltransferase involved in cell wall biosynthesis